VTLEQKNGLNVRICENILVISSLCGLKKNVGNFQQDVNYWEEFYKLGKDEWKLWLQKPDRLGRDEWKCSSKDWHVFKSNFLVCWSGRMNVLSRSREFWKMKKKISRLTVTTTNRRRTLSTLLFASQFLEKM